MEATPRPTCQTPGCDRGAEPYTTKGGNPSWRQICAAHRKRRQRGTDLTAPVLDVGPRGEGTITNYGYRRVYLPEHPLAQADGYILEHRAVAYDVYGPAPHTCHWCMNTLTDWSAIEVDHHDGNRLNNDPANLLLACSDCNKARARAGNPLDWTGR